jgi:hypothetical protein
VVDRDCDEAQEQQCQNCRFGYTGWRELHVNLVAQECLWVPVGPDHDPAVSVERRKGLRQQSQQRIVAVANGDGLGHVQVPQQTVGSLGEQFRKG